MEFNSQVKNKDNSKNRTNIYSKNCIDFVSVMLYNIV